MGDRRQPNGRYLVAGESGMDLGLRWADCDLPPGLTLTLRTTHAEVVASLTHDGSGLRVVALATVRLNLEKRSKADDQRALDQALVVARAWVAGHPDLWTVDWARDGETLRSDRTAARVASGQPRPRRKVTVLRQGPPLGTWTIFDAGRAVAWGRGAFERRAR